MTNIDFYKRFIDDLVSIRECVYTKWVNEKGWPDTDENKVVNHFISSLPDEQKDLLCQLLQNARDGGIHDTLAYLSEEMQGGLEIKKDDLLLPVEPFDSELYYDWVCRVEGDSWPDEK